MEEAQTPDHTPVTEQAQKKRKVTKREAPFLTELLREMRQCGGWAMKLPDMPARKGSGMKGGRFNLPKKFDVVCTSPYIDGQMTAIEGKMWTLKSEPTFERLLKELRPAKGKDPGQYQNLVDVMNHGGRAFIVVKRFVARDSMYWIADIKTRRIRRCVCVNEMARLIIHPFQ